MGAATVLFLEVCRVAYEFRTPALDQGGYGLPGEPQSVLLAI